MFNELTHELLDLTADVKGGPSRLFAMTIAGCCCSSCCWS